MNRLMRSGKITDEMRWAAYQILRHCEAIEELPSEWTLIEGALVGTHCIPTSNPHRVDCGNNQDAWPRCVKNDFGRVFVPWKRALDSMHANAFDVVINVLVWGETLRWIDRDLHEIDVRFQKHDGFAEQAVIEGLKLYIHFAKSC